MIISLYAHGMTVRDILHRLNQVYGTELSPEQVSAITDGVAGGGAGLAEPGCWTRSGRWCSWMRSCATRRQCAVRRWESKEV